MPEKQYNVFDRWSSPDWDDATREAVRKRLEEIPPIRFFTEQEVRIAEAVAARIVFVDRLEEPIPIIPWIDQKLYMDQRDGFRYEGLPPQREAWRSGLAGIEETSLIEFQTSFANLPRENQDHVLAHIQEGNPPGEIWQKLPAKLFFQEMLCKHIVRTFYTNPATWNLIGYSGPSAIRGHVRKGEGEIDEWEAKTSER